MDRIIRHIENLREKPEHIKKRYAFLVSFSVTFIIFAGWIASYGFKPSGVLADRVNGIEAPVSSLTAAVSGAYSDIKSIIFNSNKTEYSSDALEVTGGSK